MRRIIYFILPSKSKKNQKNMYYCKRDHLFDAISEENNILYISNLSWYLVLFGSIF